MRDSKEVELLSIRRALTLWRAFGQGTLVIEGDSENAIKWAKGLKRPPLRMITISREIRGLIAGLVIHVNRSANAVIDFLAKNGIFNSASGVFCI